MTAFAPIQDIVSNCLCHGCGTCVSACPLQAVQMRETPAGFLVPQVSDKCNGCGICGEVCPGIDVSQLVDGLHKDKIDPFYGPVIKAYIARATNPQIHSHGQSGGVVTALLTFLISSGMSDGALVTGPIGANRRPQPYVATSSNDLLPSQGSKYCPNALNVCLKSPEFTCLKNPAIVALPCQTHGIRLLQKQGLLKPEPLVLGLICAGVYSYQLIDHLSDVASKKKIDSTEFCFRDKAAFGWPGDVGIHTASQGIVKISTRHRAIAKTAFRHVRCYLCFDQMAAFSDIAFGDPWGIDNDKKGDTIVIVRTSRGHEAFMAALNGDHVTAKELDVYKIFKGQTVDSRHRINWNHSNIVWKDLNNKLPCCGIDTVPGAATARTRKKLRNQILYAYDYFSSKDTDHARLLSHRQLSRDRTIYWLRSLFRLGLKLYKTISRQISSA